MWVHCSKCQTVIGKVNFFLTSPPEFEKYNPGMDIYPERSICDKCLKEEALNEKKA